MTTTLNLRPGTHHLKFIVDGEMRASDTLPTAVDFTNHLVNYIEISADDARQNDKSNLPSGVRPPDALSPDAKEGQAEDTADEAVKKEEVEEEVPPGDFGSAIPQFLADLDKEEDSPAYLQAANVIGDTPTPPSLPLFLGKSILNSTTPTKDDSSVLNYPNHTVLNHLATSSIKNGVLATSVTTRYKRKVRTFQIYPSFILTVSSMSQPFCTNLPAISRASELFPAARGLVLRVKFANSHTGCEASELSSASNVLESCRCEAVPSKQSSITASIRRRTPVRITIYCMIFKALHDMFRSCAGVRMSMSQNKSVSRLRRFFHAVRFTHLLQRDLVCKASTKSWMLKILRQIQ